MRTGCAEWSSALCVIQCGCELKKKRGLDALFPTGCPKVSERLAISSPSSTSSLQPNPPRPTTSKWLLVTSMVRLSLQARVRTSPIDQLSHPPTQFTSPNTDCRYI